MKTPEEQREYGRQWYNRRRTEWISAHGPCARCGSWEDLELDHIDPRTKVDSHVWSWSAPRRAAELAKCQVLCHRCHQLKTVTEDYPPQGCGTHAAYNRGCRCDECRTAHAAYQLETKRKRKANPGAALDRKQPVTPEQIAAAENLARRYPDMTARQIGAAVGVGRYTIYRYINIKALRGPP